MPELIPKGYQTWFTIDNQPWKERISSKEDYVCPESNRWYANIPAEYFEIVEDKKPFKFEKGKWYKNSANNFAKCKFVKDASSLNLMNVLIMEIILSINLIGSITPT